MTDIPKFIDSIRRLKRDAKNERNDDEFDSASTIIQSAITQLEKVLQEADEKRTNAENEDLNFEMSECLGLKGGIYRRWALSETTPERDKLKISYDSYDNGYEYEKKINRPVTYNMLNRLVGRILYEPKWFSAETENHGEKNFLLNELNLTYDTIESQKRAGRNDIWTLADLGLNKLLLEKEDYEKAFSEFIEKNPGASDYKSLLETLRPLSKLPIGPQESLLKAVKFLEKKFSLLS